jgi:hypothetical protein
MKLLPKQSALILLVINSAGKGIPLAVVREKMRGAWGGVVTERPIASISNYGTAFFDLLTIQHPRACK